MALDRHARALRDRIRDLAGKAYWNQFADAPEFVVLFVPGDQFLERHHVAPLRGPHQRLVVRCGMSFLRHGFDEVASRAIQRA